MAVCVQEIKIDGWGNKFCLYAEESSTDSANNKSTVHNWLELRVVSGGNVAAERIKVGVRGADDVYLGYKSYGSGTHKLIEGWFELDHKKDGSQVATAWGHFYSGIGDWNLSGDITLTKFDRRSTINSFIGNDVKGDFKVTYTPKANYYNNILRISIPNVWAVQYIENYTSNTTFRLSQAAINYINNYANQHNLKTVSLGAVIETYYKNDNNQNVLVGESTELINNCKLQREGYVWVNGSSKRATPYIRINNEWKETTPYMRVNGVWKEES